MQSRVCFDSSSPEDTLRLAHRFSDLVVKDWDKWACGGQPLVVTLEGELGVGKTFFVRGFVQQIAAYYHQNEALPLVNSPSYGLLNYYPLCVPVTHIDCYRLSDESELEALAVRDYLNSPNVMFIEWPSKVGGFFSNFSIAVKFFYKNDKRILQFQLGNNGIACQNIIQPWLHTLEY